MDDGDACRDAFWKIYQEHCSQGRHHENQRSTVATGLIAVAAAIAGLVTFDDKLTLIDLPLTLFIVAIGLFGALFSAKQYERFRFHMEAAGLHRDQIDSLLTCGTSLKSLRTQAKTANGDKFPRLYKLRLNCFWLGLYLFICALGVTLSVLAFADAVP